MPCSASHFLAFPSESEEVRTSTTMNFVVRCCSRFQPWQLFSLRFAISRHLIDNDKWKTVTKLSSTTQVAWPIFNGTTHLNKLSKGCFFQHPVKRCQKMWKDVKRESWQSDLQSDSPSDRVIARSGRPWAYWVNRCSTAQNLSLCGSSTITGPSELICFKVWHETFFLQTMPQLISNLHWSSAETPRLHGFCISRICALLSAKGSAIFISLPHTSHWAVKRLGT